MTRSLKKKVYRLPGHPDNARTGRTRRRFEESTHSAVRLTKHPPTFITGSVQLEEPQHPILRALLPAILQPYFQRNPKVQAAANHITKAEGGPVHYDHIAFRTFGVSDPPQADPASHLRF